MNLTKIKGTLQQLLTAITLPQRKKNKELHYDYMVFFKKIKKGGQMKSKHFFEPHVQYKLLSLSKVILFQQQ